MNHPRAKGMFEGNNSRTRSFRRRSRIIVEVAVVPPAIAGPAAAGPVVAPLAVVEVVVQEPGLPPS